MPNGATAPGTNQMGLGALADRIGPERTVGLPAGPIEGLAYDSRQVTTGYLFFAVPGVHVDGHDFVTDAIARGAVAVVVERELPGAGVPQLVVADARHALADAAHAWFGEPGRRLEAIGVTGTDGKTTTTFLSAAALRAGGRRPGLIGTVAVRVGDEDRHNEARATTPEALELHALLAEMVAAGNDAVVLEASSHGLAQGRLRNVRFAAAVVQRVTSEHLEFHKTLDAYRAAKARLVEEAAQVILNRDDEEHFDYFRARAAGPVISYGLHAKADVRADGVEARPESTSFEVHARSWRGRVQLQLPGSFNVSNALAALALAETLGIDLGAASREVEAVRGVPGRMERMDAGQPFAVIVDYAHTADALAKVLRELRPLTAGRLIVVFGSAGERDRTKRPAMGRVAAELANLVVVTDEDPRGESPEAINEEIAAGARTAGAAEGEQLFVIADRRAAIGHAIRLARPGDLILLAGKGHEQNILYPDGPRWWDEREVARQELHAAGYGKGADG
jgi:UDP-N-acetylmuramoyl-L-alanyl-D-glutamate--2,6-diaminopimelate ligase